MKQAPKL